MKYSLSLLVMSLLLGCGAPTSEFGSSEVFLETSQGFPLDYVVAQNSCNKEISISDPETRTFSDGDYNLERVVDFNASSKQEKSIDFGGEFEIDMRGTTRVRLEIKKPAPFNYCLESKVFDENTLEDATLSVLAPLRKFGKEYSYLISKYRIPKVKLEILPKYSEISRYRQQNKNIKHKAYIVNNAMYIGTLDTLVFLPQGQTNYGFVPYNNVPLWKSPTVVMHEYGHHFFKYVSLDKINIKNIHHEHTSLCMDNRHVGFQSTSSTARTRELPNKTDALLALNEGFADLFSFYSLGGEKKQYYKKMDCMENTRDVGRSYFYSRADKKLSEGVLDNFMSSESNISERCSIATNYQDPHVIGAIYAHAFYEVMEGLSIRESTKMQLLINWASALELDYKQSVGAKDLLERAAENFYRRVRIYRGFNKTKCRAFKNNFPTIDIQCS